MMHDESPTAKVSSCFAPQPPPQVMMDESARTYSANQTAEFPGHFMNFPPYQTMTGNASSQMGAYGTSQENSLSTTSNVSMLHAEEEVLRILKEDSRETSPKRKKRKKAKDKPKRPLSAYNLFFKEERARILKVIPDHKNDDIEDDIGPDEHDLEQKGKKGLTAGKQMIVKARQRPHGKISFETLAKTIGRRWKELPPDRLVHYKALAGKEMQRYKSQMAVYTEKMESDALKDSQDARKGCKQRKKKQNESDGKNIDGNRGLHLQQQHPMPSPNAGPVMHNMAMGMSGMPPVMPMGMPLQQTSSPSLVYPIRQDELQQQQMQPGGMFATSRCPSGYVIGNSPYQQPSCPSFHGNDPPMNYNFSNATNDCGTSWQRDPEVTVNTKAESQCDSDFGGTISHSFYTSHHYPQA